MTAFFEETMAAAEIVNIQPLPSMTPSVAREAATLCSKVVGELVDPAQLLSAHRLGQLISNGTAHLRGLTRPVSQDTAAIEARVAKNNHVYGTTDGLKLFISQELSLAIAIFPEATAFDYSRPDQPPQKIPGSKIGIVPTTFRGGYPSMGYKDDTGVVAPFVRRDQASQAQHGGLRHLSTDRKLEVLNYQEMMQLSHQQLRFDEILIQSDWYMDSDNQDEVVGRANLQERRPYNGIGAFVDGIAGHEIFTVNNEYDSIKSLLRACGVDISVPKSTVTIREIAAFCNVVAKVVGRERWKLAGTEFTNGGSYWLEDPDRSAFAARDFFLASY